MPTRRTVLAAALATTALATLTACASAASTPNGPPVPRRLSQPPVPPGATVAFYGDSLSAGFGASSPALRWPTLLCARNHWVEVNPSIPGLGFVRNRAALGADLPADIVAADPDLVVVAMGHNDLLALLDGGSGTGLADPTTLTAEQIQRPLGDDVQAALDDDLDRLRAGLPDTPIVVFAPFWWFPAFPAQLRVLTAWSADAAARIDAAFVPESQQWAIGRPEWTIADHVHFNDAGNAAIADLAHAALRRATPAPTRRPPGTTNPPTRPTPR